MHQQVVFVDEVGCDETLDEAGAAMGYQGFAGFLLEAVDGAYEITFYPGVGPGCKRPYRGRCGCP
jgi:hypothetical protein